MALKTFCIIGVLVLCVPCVGQETDYTIEALYTANQPVIDGLENETIWEEVASVMLKDNRSGNETRKSEVHTQVKSCYDDNTLYFFFHCTDPDIWTTFTERDEHLWENEAVEIFIDVDDDTETYVEIEVSPANVLFDSYIVDTLNIDVPETALFNLKGVRTAVALSGTLNERKDRDEYWTVEIAIPFVDLLNTNIQQITSDTEMRINFYRLDENKDQERKYYAWSPTAGRFHKPSYFGRLIFKQ